MTLVIVNGESVTNESRKKMVQSAAGLFGSQGMNATSFSDVLADSGAPRGSIYFHFPGGKRELAKDAIRLTSDQVVAHVRSSPAGSAAEILEHFVALFQHVVEATDGAAGCAVAGVTIDVPASDEELLAEARAAFHSWAAILAEQLTATGVARERALGIATLAVAGVEGALILCRAEGGTAPMDAVASQLQLLVAL
jgi:TetR/AcrR family transcriptional repressor of lmrAB and yxaGH operons